MFPHSPDVGANLRRLRIERKLSLASVAEDARISVSTLSRVETNKQSMDVELLVTLARILGATPAEVLGEPNGEGLRAILRRLAELSPAESAQVFIDASRRSEPKDAATAIDELLAAIDILREDLEDLRRSLRRSRRSK